MLTLNFRVQREKALKNGKIRLIDLSFFHWFSFEKIDRFFGGQEDYASFKVSKKYQC